MVLRTEGIIVKVSVLFSDHTPDSIHDLYQDIVCELWRSYAGFRHASSENTWVYRVALNTARRHRRRLRRTPVTVSLDNTRLDSLAAEARDELLERLYELIERLPDRYRNLAYLYLDNLPLRDIAAVLNVSENTVKQRIKYMKQKLIKMKEDEER